MKTKRVWVFIIIFAVIAVTVLAVPIPKAALDDGGTREYAAMTYRIVKWKKFYAGGTYEKTKVYFGKDLKKTLDELWAEEAEGIEHVFDAEITEINGSVVTVRPAAGTAEAASSDKIQFGTGNLERIGFNVGTVVQVTYRGGIRETYPAQIKAISWKKADDLRDRDFDGEWLDKSTAEKIEKDSTGHVIITKIYADCFFASPVIPSPYELKLNGRLSDEYCVGDHVLCRVENYCADSEAEHHEADVLSVEPSDWAPDPYVAYKPVVYLYPEAETDVYVNLDLDGALTCTYPKYKNGWRVKASPNGVLTDENGTEYNYLYWEGETNARFDFSKGFCVKGGDTAAFLETALEKLGLNRREANEFIVFWLPLMEQNPYNVISFQADCYTQAAKLEVEPAPDTVIRVFMAWQKSDAFVEIAEQVLTAPERRGFTVVEWGGTEISTGDEN